MTHQALISSTLILLLLHSTTTISAETPIPVKSQPSIQPPSQAPESPIEKKSAPPNVTDILEKAGGFSMFTRLLRETNVVNQIENQLNSSNELTILAPPDSGFSGLKSGTLNSLTAEQKVQLLQFHILPNLVSLQNFETLTNPVRTQASNTEDYPLNISTGAGNSVNVSTGVINATLSGTVYSDSKLAVYRVDTVLLPLAIFGPGVDSPSPAPSPAMAPAPEAVPALKKKPKKEASAAKAKAGTADLAATPTSSAKAPAVNANSSMAAVSPALVVDESGGVVRLVEVGFVVMAVVLGQLVV